MAAPVKNAGALTLDLFGDPEPSPETPVHRSPVTVPAAPPAKPAPAPKRERMVVTEPVAPPPALTEKEIAAREREDGMRVANERAARFGNLRLAYLAAIRIRLMDGAPFSHLLGRGNESPVKFLIEVEKDPTLLDLLANMALCGIASRRPEMKPERWARAHDATLQFLEFAATHFNTAPWKGVENVSP